MIRYQILQTNIVRIVWQTVRRITKEIFGVEGLRRGKISIKTRIKLELIGLYSEVRPDRLNNNSAQNSERGKQMNIIIQLHKVEYKYPAILYGYLDSCLFFTVKILFNQLAAPATFLYPLFSSRLMRNDKKDLAVRKAVG